MPAPFISTTCYVAVVNRSFACVNLGLLEFDAEGYVIGGINNGVPWEDLGEENISFSEAPFPDDPEELFKVLSKRVAAIARD